MIWNRQRTSLHGCPSCISTAGQGFAHCFIKRCPAILLILQPCKPPRTLPTEKLMPQAW